MLTCPYLKQAEPLPLGHWLTQYSVKPQGEGICLAAQGCSWQTQPLIVFADACLQVSLNELPLPSGHQVGARMRVPAVHTFNLGYFCAHGAGQLSSHAPWRAAEGLATRVG